MQNVQVVIRQLAEDARVLHLKERHISLESVLLIGEIVRMNVWVNLYMSSENFAAYIGLTPSQFWKRAQAARVIAAHPEAMTMLAAGETHISHVALLAPKITQANAKLLLDGVKNQTKRAVQELVSRVTNDGRLLEREAEFEIKLTLTKTQMASLDRAREVLAHGGHVPSMADIIVKAAEDLLDRRDPLRKAKRVELRRQKAEMAAMVSERASPAKGAASLEVTGSNGADSGPERPSPGKEGRDHARRQRPAVPAAVRHALWLRDEGQCSFRHEDGSRCPERMMLELDHATKMWCHGGRHVREEMALRCRAHNQATAERFLGKTFMTKKISERTASRAQT